MDSNIELLATRIKEQIEYEFNNINEQEFEEFFDKFQNDKRTISFIEYYNKTVLDKEKIIFKEFKHEWKLRFTRTFYNYFDSNHDKLIYEIASKKNIKEFNNKYCIDKYAKKNKSRQDSFCSKLFHTILPSEFPPLDDAIRNKFGLQNKDFITSVLIIKKGYEFFIENNPEKINLLRNILSKNKFFYLRIKELSDIRILDMYYWFKENREKTLFEGN